jgi:hypothetical protein
MKLGKLAPKYDERTLRLGRYIKAWKLPPLPDSYALSPKTNSRFGMMLNDNISDCVVAGAGHAIQVWTANAKAKMFTPPDKKILTVYEVISGYSPKVASSDRGAYMIDMLNLWRKVGLAGHKIDAFMKMALDDPLHLKFSIYAFGGGYTGFNLPRSAQVETIWSSTVDVPGSWGGHCVQICDYNPIGPICVTWGALKQMTWAFFNKYCDEGYAIISKDFIKANKMTPSGFDMKTLQTDLVEVTR